MRSLEEAPEVVLIRPAEMFWLPEDIMPLCEQVTVLPSELIAVTVNSVLSQFRPPWLVRMMEPTCSIPPDRLPPKLMPLEVL